MDANVAIRSATRDHLVHIMPELRVSGDYSFMTAVVRQLNKQYAHTLLYESDPITVDPDLIYQAQLTGMNVLQTDRITQDVIDSSEYTGAILYNVTDRPGIGKVVPSVYYSAGIYDSEVGASVVVPCSDFAAIHGRREPYITQLDKSLVVGPMIETRSLRRVKTPDHTYTVGMITSGTHDKYPCDLVMQLLGRLPEDVCVMMTTMPAYRNPGMLLAIDDRADRTRQLTRCPVTVTGMMKYLPSLDVLIYGSAKDHYEPAGRLVLEAMALGKPVICERKGVFETILEHGVNAMLYNTVDEAIAYFELIRKDQEMTKKLRTNAQLRASWEDVSVHAGKLRRILRSIGA